MTKHVDPTAAVLAALMAEVKALRGEVAELRADRGPQVQLSDFSKNLGRLLKKRFEWRTKQPGAKPAVWSDKDTGQWRASVTDILSALRIRSTKADFATLIWSHVHDFDGQWGERTDLKKGAPKSTPTLVIDLEIAEELITRVYPRKGPAAITKFKETF